MASRTLPLTSRMSLPLRPRQLRLVALVACAALSLTVGWLWLRDSSLVRVSDVTITGVSGAQATTIRQALAGAAGEMTTLNVQPARLRAAVAPFAIVRSVSATPDFPHKLRITVVEHTPVAAVMVGGRPTPVAEDGTVLRGFDAQGLTPLRSHTPPSGRVLRGPVLVASVRLLAAASPAMRERVAKIYMGPGGLTVRVKSGPSAIFGSARRARAKWSALATLLATEAVADATRIDLTVPERPAVTKPQPLAPAVAATTVPATGVAPVTTAAATPVTPAVPAAATPTTP